MYNRPKNTEAYKCTTGARTQGFTNVLYNGLLNTGTHKCTKYPKIQGLTHVQQILNRIACNVTIIQWILKYAVELITNGQQNLK